MPTLSFSPSNDRTYLVNEVLEVLVSKRLPRCDDPVHIGLHEICDDIHVFEVGRVRRNRHNVGNRDDILVSVEMPQQLDLPHDALGVYEVAENVADFLNRHLPALDLKWYHVPARNDKRSQEVSPCHITHSVTTASFN